MDAPPPANDDPAGVDPVALARRCWDDLSEQRVRRRLALRALAARLRREFPDSAPAHSTLQDWMVSRKSLPDRLLFLAVVRHLDLDEREWTGRWEEYDRVRSTSLRRRRRPAIVPSPLNIERVSRMERRQHLRPFLGHGFTDHAQRVRTHHAPHSGRMRGGERNSGRRQGWRRMRGRHRRSRRLCRPQCRPCTDRARGRHRENDHSSCSRLFQPLFTGRGPAGRRAVWFTS
jgi:hypothetical protein